MKHADFYSYPNAAGSNGATHSNSPTTEPPNRTPEITVLEGMELLFDEKVGLTPVKVVEKSSP